MKNKSSLSSIGTFIRVSWRLPVILFFLLLAVGSNTGFSQTTLLDEDFGTGTTFPTGWTASSTDWTNNTANASNGYTDASGGSNAFFGPTSTTAKTLTYSNTLSTVGYTNISVLWGGRYVTSSTYTINIVLSWSANGTTWNNVTFTNVAAVPSTNTLWGLVNNGTRIALPAGAAGIPNLRLRFTATASSSLASSSNTIYRLDDVTITGCSTSAGAISYSGSPFCKSITTAQPVTPSAITGGTYTATPAGLTINATTGEINPSTSTAGTYTVTYTLGCAAVTTTTSVTITAAPSATISYSGSPFCKSLSTAQAVTQTGTTGGTYSSTSGLTINASTGAITPSTSTAGTYTVTYTVPASGGCAAFATTTSVQVLALISGNTLDFTNGAHGVLCATTNENGTATITAPAGSVFTTIGFASYGTPAGSCPLFTYGSCHAAGSQAIAESYVLGNNTASIPITNSIFGDPCSGTVKTFAIQATYTQPICSGTSPGTITGTTPTGGNGIYSYFWEMSTTNSSTGFAAAPGTNNAINYTPGTLTQTTWYRRTVNSGGCSDISKVIQVTVLPAPSATISYTGSPYCSSAGTATVTRTGTAGGTYSSTAGLIIDGATGNITLATSTAGTYTVTYTIAASGGCAAYTTTTSITITTQPFANGYYAANPYCSNGGTATPTGTASGAIGTFTSSSGLSVNSTSGAVNLGASTPGTYTVTYTVPSSGGCSVYTQTSSITITAAPVAAISYAGSPYCSNAGTATVTQTGTTGGTYTSTTGLTINASTGSITTGTSTAGTYTVTYTVAASGGCAAVTATASVTISTARAATISYTGTPYCSNAAPASVSFSGTTGGTYSSTAGLYINATTGTILLSASTAGTYTVTYTIAAGGGCSAYTTTTSVTILPAPAISQVPTANIIAYYKFEGDANDATGNNNGALQNSPALSADRFNNAGKAYTFNGSTQYASTTNLYTNPNNFTLSIWFKTTSTTGGKLIGFGNAQTGLSANHDRHIYMSNTGQLYFGVFSGSGITVNSALSYNDGKWHLATASLSTVAGMSLYVDGAQVGSNASVVSAQNYSGYWRIGYDNVNSWPSQPSSFYFNGSLDDALIYQSVLTPAEVAALYASPDGAGNNGPVCAGSTLSLTATTVSGATYAWTGPNGFTSALKSPTLVYNTAQAGVYTLQVTAGGCTATAYTNVTSSTIAGQWTGNISTDWANTGNWCNGILPSSSTNVVIGAGAARMPSIISSVSCNSLTINTGASVTIASAGTLNISGTLINNGTYTDNGTTVFNGTTGQQTFSGVNTFNNLTLSNATGLLLPTAIVVKNNITISAGTLNVNNLAVSVAGNWVNNGAATALTAGTGTVTFNGTTAQTIGGSFGTTFNNLTISNTGSTVSLLVNTSVAGNLNVATGLFDLGAFTANRTTAGGTLTIANNASLKVGGTNTYPANYTTNNLAVASTVEYSGTDQTVANQPYGNLALSSAAGAVIKTSPVSGLVVLGNLTTMPGTGTSVVFNATANITVTGNVSIGVSTTFNGNSFTHSMGGNWVNSGTFNGNTGTITFTGAGTSVSGSGVQNFNNLTVAAPAVSFSGNSITVTGNLATTGSGSFTQAAGGTLVMSGTGKTISGVDISLNNLTISGSVTTSTSFTLSGNLSVNGSFSASSGSITMSGVSKIISGTGTIGFNILFVTGTLSCTADFSVASAITVGGSFTASAGTATFTGTSSLSGTANLYNVVINGTSLRLSTDAVLGIANGLTITSGMLDVATSGNNTVNFNGTGAQNVNGITYSNLILSNGSTKTAIGAITTNEDITIASGTTFIPASYIHSIYGNWINNGTFVTGTSTIQFRGPANGYIKGNTTFNILTVNTTNPETVIDLKSNISAAIVNMTNGVLLTGVNTLTITNTRTGAGFIRGTIQRTHAFTTGVAYAFEGPQNTITFSAVSGVSTVTVYVDEQSIADFPFGGAVNRVYDISVPAGTYTASLRLHYEDDELNGNNELTMALWHYNASIWGSSGKTGNDTTSNYVEQSGLTNITNRWTFSDDGNLVQWNGSVSSDWNTPANWTVLQGSGSRPPSSSDIVDLGTVVFNNQPTITSSATAKNIVFGSAKAVTLTLSTGGSLTTMGSINGNWTSSVKHTINVNNQTLTANGKLDLSDGTNGHAIDLNIGAGTVNVFSLSESGNADIRFNGLGTLKIFEDFVHSSGTFTAGSGTVIYNGSENQDVANVNYNNLTIEKTGGLADIHDTVNIAGNLLISSGELNNFSNTTVAGDVTINPAGKLNNYSTLHVRGNWNNNGTYVAQGSSIYFEGSGTQTISASTFSNLYINKPVGSIAVLTGDVTLKGNLFGLSGTLDTKSFFFNRDVQGGTATISDSATLIIAADNAPNKFSTYNLAPNSTVIFNGTVPQHLLLPGVVYGNIVFRNSGTKTLYTSITANTSLLIDSTATFDAGANTITLNGNWINKGTFIPSTSTVLLNGTTKTISGNTTFNKVTTLGSYSYLSNITHNGLLNITSTGSLSAASNITVVLNADLINSGVLNNLGTTTFTGNVLQTLSLINAVQTVAVTVNFNGTVSPVLNSTSTPQFGYLNINNTGGINPSVRWNIAYALTIGSGASFNGGTSSHYLYGNVTNNGTITSSGTLIFIPATAATVNLGSNFSSTGRVYFAGAGAMTLAGTGLVLHNVNINNSNIAGITPPSGWNIDNDLTIAAGSIMNAGNYTHAVGGNLLNNGTINSGTSTFVLNGSGLQNVNSANAFNNLTVNKPSDVVTLSANATVNGALNFISGKIKTGNYAVVQPLSGSVAGAGQTTGWVNGKLQKQVAAGAFIKSFEVGDSAIYAPASLVFSGITTGGYTTLSTTAGDHPNIISSTINSDKSVNRIWTIVNSGVSFTSYNGTFYFANSDVDNGTNTAALKAGLYNGSSWIMPVTDSSQANSVRATGITTVGDIAIGEICNAGTTIAFADSIYCSNAGMATIIRTGTAGGTYTAAAGLAINSSTGAVNLAASTPGNYIVTYTIAASGGCKTYITTAQIVISQAPAATIAYAGSPYCSDGGMAIVTQTGTSGGTYASSAGLLLNTTTGAVNIATSTVGTYTVTYTVPAAGGCGQFQTSTVLTIRTAGTWAGTVSTDYSNAQNWLCGTLPSTSTPVIIPAGLTNYPVISGTAAATNISIANGASLKVTGTLQLAGTITNNGKFSATSGTVEFNGSTAQQIAAGLFDSALVKNLTINNGAGVTLSTPLSLTGILQISAGQLNTGDQLTLKSSATNTAMVGAITSAAATPVSGKVTVERFIPGRRKYRLITASVTTSTATTLTTGQEALSIWGAWQNGGVNSPANIGTFITGGAAADGFDIQTSNASLFTYDDVNRRFVGYTTANGKNTKYTPLKAGIAYYMFVYGDRTNTITTSSPNPTVLSAKGTLLTGNQLYTTSSAIPLSPVTDRFTLLGNPFASTINWATIPKTNLADSYWGWDPNLNSTGGYVTVLSSGAITLQAPYSGSTGLNQYIQPGQGFFVKTSGTAPTLTIREQDKVTTLNTTAFRTTTADSLSLIAINLFYPNGSNTVLADGVLAAFDATFQNRAGAEDGFKLANSTENIAILNDTNWLSIDARRLPLSGDTIFLNVSKLTKPQYTLQIFMQQMANSGLQAYLQDRYLNQLQLLSSTDTNTIVINIVPGVAASSDTNRFRIVFRSANTPLPVLFTSIKANAMGKQVLVDWEVASETGIKVYKIERSLDGIHFTQVSEVVAGGNNGTKNYRWLDAAPATGNNYYRVRAVAADSKFLLSKTAVAKLNTAEFLFNLFPNPVQGKQLTVQASNLEKGTYYLQVRNALGQQIFQTTIIHIGGTFSQRILFEKNLAPDIYYLEITNNNSKHQQPFLVQ